MDILEKINNKDELSKVLHLLSISERQFHDRIIEANYESWDKFYHDIERLYPKFCKEKDCLRKVLEQIR